MRRRTKAVIGVVVAIALVAVFFFVPIVAENVAPCLILGNGYASLSYHFFNAGEIYRNGQFYWSTQNPVSNCF